jgi:Uma2 family endonuclease
MDATTLLTFAEFERLPDSPGKQELLDGELIDIPPAKARHVKIQHRIYARLTPYALDQRLGEVYAAAGYKLGERHCVQPDVSLVSPEQDEAGDQEGYFEGAPRLTIEVISEANKAESVDRKIEKYFAYGGEEVWVFYPKTRRVWLYRRSEPTAIEHKEVLTSIMFPDWKLNLSEVFA